MATITECGVETSTQGWRLGAVQARLAGWAARRRCRAAIAQVPDHLRRDVGLDGGLALARFENGGRTFVVGRRPEATLSGWYL